MAKAPLMATLLLAAVLAGCSGDSGDADASACERYEDIPDERAPFDGPTDDVRVRFETTLGDFVVETEAEHANVTVANFLQYVDDGFYSCTTFHRIVPDFVVQGGGLYADGSRKETRDPIPLEATEEEPNVQWSVAMARTSAPSSATSQFFVNIVDNQRSLNPGGVDPNGYAVFGHLVAGQDTVEAMLDVPRQGGSSPTEPIVIIRAHRE